MLPTITIGTVAVEMYTLMMGVGMLGMLFVVLRRRKKLNLSVFQSISFTLLMIFVGLIGACLLGYISWGKIGSMDMFGAIFLIAPVIPGVGKKFGLTATQALDLSAFCMIVVNTFIKIGCFFAGCCEGIVIYVGNRYFQWPLQITMSLADILIILWLLRIEGNGNKQGALYPLFLISYGLMRLIADGLMYFETLMWGLRPAQWYGLIAAVIGCIWLIIYKKRIDETNPQCLK